MNTLLVLGLCLVALEIAFGIALAWLDEIR